MSLSHTHLSLSLTFQFHYSRLSSLLLLSIADVATGTPFYLAKVGQPGGTPRTIARFHDSFRGSLPQIPCAIWVFHENSDGISWLILLSVAPCHMQVKRLYDDGLVDDNKKKLGLTQWKILLQVKKDMSQEKPITLKKVTGSPTSSPQNNSIMQGLANLFFTYVKYHGQKNYCAFDINEGRPVRNLIYATMVENTVENQQKLQELANRNNDIDLTIQLRDRNGKIACQTK